jgi:cationic peptide transport system ATP-binding protein
MGVSFIYVSQQIGLVKHISDKIIVMEKGNVVESADTTQLIESPQHPVTKKLINSHFYQAPNY